MPEPIDCATFQFYTPACHPLPIYHAPVETTSQLMTGFALGIGAAALVLVLILVFVLFNNRNK